MFNCDEESAFGKVVLVQRFSLLNSCNRFLTPTRSKWTVNSPTISLSNYVTPTICLLLAFPMIRFQCVTSYQKGPMLEHALETQIHGEDYRFASRSTKEVHLSSSFIHPAHNYFSRRLLCSRSPSRLVSPRGAQLVRLPCLHN